MYKKLILSILILLLCSCYLFDSNCTLEGIDMDDEFCQYHLYGTDLECNDYPVQGNCELLQEQQGICEWDNEIEMCIKGENDE
tara:strand:- start:317 stop:565 length:249 start_codon:yes stop_codon:yes gene_type:complete